MSIPQLLILSSETASGLAAARRSLREFLQRDAAVNLIDVAYTLQMGGQALPYRCAVVCTNREDAISVLAEEGSKHVLSTWVEGRPRAVVFLLPGVGDQYLGMGHELYLKWPVFKTEVDRCAEILSVCLGTDIRDILYPPGESWKRQTSAKGIDLKQMIARSSDTPEGRDAQRLNRTLYAQPALFTIEYASARLLQSFGIKPSAIVGHSMGEYVAACLAGVFSLEDALRLVAARAALVDELPQGAMLSTLLAEDELLPLLGPDLSLSLVNGANNCVVAGPAPAVEEFERLLDSRDVISRRIRNGHAFHTKALDPIVEELESEAAKIPFALPQIPYSSNVTGNWVTGRETGNPQYWTRHATQTAKFSAALSHAWRLGDPIFVECGPGRTLSVLAAQHPERKMNRLGAIYTLRPRYENDTDEDVLLRAVSRLWLSGVSIDWEKLLRGGEVHVVPLPGDIFQEEPASGGNGAGHVDKNPKSLSRTAIRSAAYVAPRDDLELSLTSVCERVLGLERVGVNDNFFELGGHSLAAIRLIEEMKRATGLEIDLGQVFQTPTIADLVTRLGSQAKTNASIVVPLQTGSDATPIFCICGIDIYREFAQSVGENQPVFGVYVDEERAIIREVLEGSTSGVSIDRLVEAYDKAISRFRPQGPYRLAGISFGGLLAVELGSRMRRRGARVDFVFLFDTLLPEGRQRLWGSWLLRQARELLGAQRRGKLMQIYTKFRLRLLGKAISASAPNRNPFYHEFSGRQRAAFFKAEKTWRARTDIDFPVVLFKASEYDMWGSDLKIAKDYGWRRHVGDNLRIVRVAGGHLSIIEMPNVVEVGRVARQFLGPRITPQQ